VKVLYFSVKNVERIILLEEKSYKTICLGEYYNNKKPTEKEIPQGLVYQFHDCTFYSYLENGTLIRQILQLHGLVLN
jgi:hypothetical protein